MTKINKTTDTIKSASTANTWVLLFKKKFCLIENTLLGSSGSHVYSFKSCALNSKLCMWANPGELCKQMRPAWIMCV